MQLSGSTRRWVTAAIAAASLACVAGRASGWVITEDEKLQQKARAGEGLVYPPPALGRRPGEFVLHEFEGPCLAPPATPGGGDDAVTCRTIGPADGAQRARITVDVNRTIRMNKVIAAELARAIEAIDPRKRDRLASLSPTTILPSAPFQPADTGGTEWTQVAFGVDGPIPLRAAAPATGRPFKLFKRLAKSMLLPAGAVFVAIVLLWIGLRRIRQKAAAA